MVIICKKIRILFLFLFLLSVSCKTQTNKIEETKNDSLANKVLENKKEVVISYEKDSLKGLKEKLVGKTYSTINQIKGFEKFHSGSSTIGEISNGKQYSLTNIRGDLNKTKYILLEESIGNEKLFKILDVLDLTKEKLLKNNNLYYHFCYKDGKQDEEIIAIAKYEEEEFLTKILKAWRADRKTEKIVEIPVDGIKVENIDYGL